MLDFFYSTMQGGKSTALLQRRFNLTSIGKKVLVMTSSLDDRFGIGKVTSRMGPQCDAELFTRDTVFEMWPSLQGIDAYSNPSRPPRPECRNHPVQSFAADEIVVAAII